MESTAHLSGTFLFFIMLYFTKNYHKEGEYLDF